MDTPSSTNEMNLANHQRYTTLKPKSGRNYRRWITILAIIVLLGLVIDKYRALNQNLYIVNGFSTPLKVNIDEGEVIIVPPQGHTKVSISEGDHTAVVSRQGTEDHNVEFTVENTLHDRISNNSTFVLNPGRSAVLMRENVIYASPQASAEQNTYTIHFGKEFFTFHEIDYAFKDTPDTIQVEGTVGIKIKVYLGMVTGKPVDLISVFPQETPPSELLGFAEHFLTINPNDSDLLWYYSLIARSQQKQQRAIKFLGARLDQKPICVDWHRNYQAFCNNKNNDEMVSKYDQMLAKAPNDSTLLYLRGRLCATRKQSFDYFNRAIKADSKNPYPPSAIAYGLVSAGEFDEARKYASTACKLSPDQQQMNLQLFNIRFALKEYGPLEKELQTKLLDKPLDMEIHTNLLRTLVAAGKTSEARQANRQYIKRISDAGQGNVAFTGHIKRTLAYFMGDSSRLTNLSTEERNHPSTIKQVEFIGGLESGDPQRIKKLLADKTQWETATNMLTLGLAWQAAGDPSEAKKCFTDAADKFASGDQDDQETSRLLKQGDKLKLSDVDELLRDRVTKAMVLVALATTSPSNRTELLDHAEKLNTLGGFPHHLVKKAIASLRK
ncbi:MAG: hypothetical protein GY794_21475 [bacterium]|nr:hypothetical protein [bacterium]